MSIFATTITARTDHSIARIRSIVRTDAAAERILAAAVVAVVAVTGEDHGAVAADIRVQAQASQATARPAVKLVSSALQAVESAYTLTHSLGGAGEGLESAAPVLDCRTGQAIAESILIAA
jgi:hypothetical protein